MTAKNEYLAIHDVQIHEPGFVQRREWMLYKIREDHYPFNVPVIFKMTAFESHLFQKTIDVLVEKHEILRTTLNLVNGRLKQVIHNPSDFPVKYTFVDFSRNVTSKKETLIDQIKLWQHTTPFNFEFGPLFRITVFALEKNLFEVVIIFHHMIFDLHSLNIFQRDIASIWSILSSETVPNNLTTTDQYTRYSALENRVLDSELGDTHRAYWRTQLINGFHRLQIIEDKKWSTYFKNIVEKIKEVKKRVFALPFYDHRFIATVVRRYRPDTAGMLHYVYSHKTVKNILEFEKNSCSSLLSLFIASFVITLNKLSGQQLFLFDLVPSRKKNDGYENVIGWLSSNGICFFDINENKGLSSFLSYIDRQLFLLSSHSIYPYEVLDCESDFPIGCAIPVLLVILDGKKSEDKPITGIRTHELEYFTTYQDLSIFLTISENSCSVEINYNNFLIAPEMIEKLIFEQERIANSIAEDDLAG